jgi:polyisoprenoid-binding protein YceI
MTTATPTRTVTSTWDIDPVHSTVEFSVKHMMVTTVKGRFGSVQGAIVVDESHPTGAQVTASVDVASVDTGVEQRDAHLRSDDFFNAERFPKIAFRSTKVERDRGNWKMTGDLTIRDVTKKVEFEVEYDGQGVDAYGKQRAGFTARGKINRRDFGVNWNGVIETGGVVVSDTVKIALSIAAVRQD